MREKSDHMNFPNTLKYTKDHEWIKVEGNVATIGITDFAQNELGDIVYVEVETVDEKLAHGEVFGTVEAVKTVSDLLMPVSGTVTAFNEDLESTPETVNEDPYENGWIIKVELSNTSEIDELLSAEDYQALIN